MAFVDHKTILPLLTGEFSGPRLERFWSKVRMSAPDECWDWQASLNSSGYGRFKIAPYEQVGAHRVALIATTQMEPMGACVLHSCDRPSCCNPNHLRFGTHADNSADKVSRGRQRSVGLQGERNPRAKLRAHHIPQIVQMFRSGLNNKQIAARTPVTHGMISLIRVGRSWRNETEALGWIVERAAA